MSTGTAFTLYIRSRSSKVGSRHVVHVHLLLVDTVPFLLVNVSVIFRSHFRLLEIILTNLFDDSFLHQLLLILTDFIFLFAFTAFLFLRFFLGTSRLVQCCQVNLADHIYLRTQFRLTDFEDLIVFRRFFLCRCCRCDFCRCCFYRSFHSVIFFRLHRCSFYLRLFFNHFFHYFFNFCRFLFYCRFRLFHRFRSYRLRLFHCLRLFHRFSLSYRFGLFYCFSLFHHWFGLNRCCHLFHLRFGFFLHFRFNNRSFHNRFFFLFRFFFHLFCFTTVQFIQVYFPDRFKLRTCILRYDCLDHIFRLRFL